MNNCLAASIGPTACGDALTGVFFPPGVIAVISVHPLPCKAFAREVRHGLSAPVVAYTLLPSFALAYHTVFTHKTDRE